MTYDEFKNALSVLNKIKIDPNVDCVTFCIDGGGYRGRLKEVFGLNMCAVLWIECIDIHDTSDAGNDFVALPLSNLKSISHNAKVWRLEKNKPWRIEKSKAV